LSIGEESICEVTFRRSWGVVEKEWLTASGERKLKINSIIGSREGRLKDSEGQGRPKLGREKGDRLSAGFRRGTGNRPEQS